MCCIGSPSGGPDCPVSWQSVPNSKPKTPSDAPGPTTPLDTVSRGPTHDAWATSTSPTPKTIAPTAIAHTRKRAICDLTHADRRRFPEPTENSGRFGSEPRGRCTRADRASFSALHDEGPVSRLRTTIAPYARCVPSRDGFALGYQRVDVDGNVPFLVATMEATSRWDAIRELRAWERQHL